jgi:hypothetical protein
VVVAVSLNLGEIGMGQVWSETYSWDRDLVIDCLDRIDFPIFRRFSNADHAEDLCRGYVYLSTLGACRKYEDAQRGDKGEAIHSYYQPGEVRSGSDDFATIAKTLGVGIPDGVSGVIIRNNLMTTRFVDGWVLCATYTDDAAMENTFGKYCVRIDKPLRFMQRVSLALRDEAEKSGYQWHSARGGMIGLVRYRAREYAGTESDPGPVGFVKPAHPYAGQEEVRMLWPAENRVSNELEPIRFECTSIRTLCTRIS